MLQSIHSARIKTMRHIIALGILFFSISVFGQEYGFDIHNTTLQEYIKMEERLGSKRIPTTSNHVSFSGDAQPIKFQRNQKEIPDLISYYFFKEKDSIMSYVLHEWDVYNFEKQDNNQKSEKLEKALIKKYNTLEKVISDLYGQSKVEGELSDVSQSKVNGGLKKKNIWIPNDSTEIEIYATISNYYEKKGMITINPTHRIRLYIKNTKKEQSVVSKLDSKRVDFLNKLTVDFFKTLESKNLSKVRVFLSDVIKEQVNDNQLNLLIENIDFKRTTELFYSGVQFGLDGSVLTMLQFKYSDDSANPPKELIKMIFDDKDKILGIQPIKLHK
jgi:hypothetical protein